ncbi:hypothetical protein MKW94_026932 [Papaver nudicaule]|uniref:Neprosin PEP catalytic domain-containing protein n=1 Tax=Papaver nudicaule TaxID=74823 RepID=A0AA41VJ63_PAPNU|nr:hypothetical protein [Papaver nudicaule]
MVSCLDITIINFVAVALLVMSLIQMYHAPIIVEGRRVDVLSEEEELDLQRQLTVLNKLPTKTIHAPWGDIYDCIEFHKQPTFDHPLFKNYTIKMRGEIVSTKNSQLETFMNQVDKCPKGTVPIRRTTRKDLIRVKSVSANTAPDKQYRAGISYTAKSGETVYGALGLFNFWNPSVNQYQFSSTEIALSAGSGEHNSILKHGWIVDPQLYGSNLTRTFAYWTGDGGKTGCYNNLCHGFVQVHSTYTLDMPLYNSSVVGGQQIASMTAITLESGKWWLTIHDNIRIGYWPGELFPAFVPGATNIFWGGRVKSGKDGVSPPMGSGRPMDDEFRNNGYIEFALYVDMENENQVPEQIEYAIDCFEHYNARYYPPGEDDEEDNFVHFGGTGGGNCK